ncbi:MAG: hypothetical protein KAJ09_06245 [Deltaproteobacteria bacterium]|nr:hypothetical protein [Deltaproteobacteria bacterium]
MVQGEKDRRAVRDRRQRPTSPFSTYVFLGRRRSIRRKTDRKTHIYVDLYGHYLFLALLLIILLSVLDAYFTIFHVERGAREINPLMDFLMGYGNTYFFIIKYTLTALGLILLCIYKSLLLSRTIIVCILFFYLTVFANHVFLILGR